MVEEPAEVIEEGFSEGLDPLLVERLVTEEDDNVIKAGSAASHEEIEAMLKDAKAQAQAIIDAAKKEAEQIRGSARDEGREEGYRDGHKEAEEECRRKYREKELECEARASAAERDFQKKSEELEPLLVEKISGIFERVTGARLENDRETVLFLLNRALTGVDSGRNYVVHVTSTDYENVKAQKEQVAKGTGILPESFEIVEDSTLSPNSCLIESEGGIWDCSLGTQLSLLVQQLKILSYE
jgi:flagellar assembly protein FliH